MKTKTNKIEYSFVQRDQHTCVVAYTIFDGKNRIVARKNGHLFVSIKPMLTARDCKNHINKMFRNMIMRLDTLSGGTKIVCLTPFADKTPTVPAPVVPHKAETNETSNDENLYEVVKACGIWTIIKHERPLLSIEEAKDVFMQKIKEEYKGKRND